MIKMYSSTNYFVDDPKVLFLPNKNFHYNKNSSGKNKPNENTVFYNRNIINLKKKSIQTLLRHSRYKKIPHRLDITVVEEIIFNKKVSKLLHFDVKSDLCYKRRKINIESVSKKEIRHKEDSYFVFLYTENINIAPQNLKKINNNIYVKKIEEVLTVKGNHMTPSIQDYSINMGLENGLQVLYIERDFFHFEPENNISIMSKRNKKYFHTFYCSHYYYVNSLFSEVMQSYYQKVEELISEYINKPENNKRIDKKLTQLNENTKIVLKQTKLLYF